MRFGKIGRNGISIVLNLQDTFETCIIKDDERSLIVTPYESAKIEKIYKMVDVYPFKV
jgi:hypothetical protein